MEPHLSVVVLTLDEEDTIGPCLGSLAGQTDQRFEVLVLDAASRDGTVRIVRQHEADHPVDLRLYTSSTRVPIGEARNRGVALARADRIAFISADAQVAPDWTGRVIAALTDADMVYGRQVHDPTTWTTAAAVRGLRYGFPSEPVDDPLPYASNVAAAYDRDLLERFPFDPDADAAEDLLLAKRADAAGYVVRYDPELVVRHHDVTTAGEEMRKNVREGRGWGLHVDELGPLMELGLWGVLLVSIVPLVLLAPMVGLPLFLAFLYAPAVRRAWRRRHDMPVHRIVQGVVASPPFDLAFLINYLRGLWGHRRRPGRHVDARETHP